jgi:hypothetical protein
MRHSDLARDGVFFRWGRSADVNNRHRVVRII